MTTRTMSDVYRAIPLYPDRKEIRLLSVFVPENPDDLVTCELTKGSVTDSTFAALSYAWNDPFAWGEPPTYRHVLVNQVRISVTYHLETALRSQHRHRSHWTGQSFIKNENSDVAGFGNVGLSDLPLWADALCINQACAEEKNHQVNMMQEIFSNAHVVLASLAPKDGSIPLAFESLKIMSQHINLRSNDMEASPCSCTIPLDWILRYPTLCPSQGSALGPGWEAIRTLNGLAYWQRLWIVQEVALARRLVYFCPSAYIWGPVLEEALSKLNFLHGEVSAGTAVLPAAIFSMNKDWDMYWSMSYRVKSTTNAYLLINAVRLFREQRYQSALHRVCHIADLCSRLRATNPRDYVYGVLALTQLDIVPDYKKDVTDVYKNFVEALLSAGRESGSSGVSTFLQFAGIQHSTQEQILPSWAPNYPAICEIKPWNRLLATWSGSASDGVCHPGTKDAVVNNLTLSISGIEVAYPLLYGHNFAEKWDSKLTFPQIVTFLEQYAGATAQSTLPLAVLGQLYAVLVSPNPSRVETRHASRYSAIQFMLFLTSLNKYGGSDGNGKVVRGFQDHLLRLSEGSSSLDQFVDRLTSQLLYELPLWEAETTPMPTAGAETMTVNMLPKATSLIGRLVASLEDGREKKGKTPKTPVLQAGSPPAPGPAPPGSSSSTHEGASLACDASPNTHANANGPRDVIGDPDEPDLEPHTAALLALFASLYQSKLCATRDGMMGVVPSKAQNGDVVCVLHQCDFPVLMREREDGKWLLVGRCIFSALMNGGTKRYLDAKGLEPEVKTFEIV